MSGVTLLLSNRSTNALALSEQELLALARFVLKEEGITRVCELSISLVDDEEMARLNETLRGVESPTDVLSIELEGPDETPLFEDEPCLLGDIILDPAYIARQARCFGTTEKAETTLLFVHGLLHLLGYDHEEEADACRMEAKEDAIVERASGGALTHAQMTRHSQGKLELDTLNPQGSQEYPQRSTERSDS